MGDGNVAIIVVIGDGGGGGQWCILWWWSLTVVMVILASHGYIRRKPFLQMNVPLREVAPSCASMRKDAFCLMYAK